jgi:thioesterase domain-containing protein/acyl carrier protein
MILPSLVAGASIVCTPGFSAHKFFEWMAAFRPTWYSAVPTIHQAILAHAAFHRKIIAECPLRFIRSSSASLPLQVLEELEKVFNAPVIESYGTTEASMIACNPLPPRKRKAGSGGVAVGQEVAIMDEVGTLLPAGEIGEIVVCGLTVMQGYDNNPAVNESTFMHGWFRTGDAGYVDTDGYLFIVGRLKEIINCGGEKIVPCEVEEALLEYPAIAQVVAFAMPHAQLGEDVAVAIVLHEDASATATEIREFAAARLADFKVPRQVIFVDQIPQGATGKVQRSGLAERLGLLVPQAQATAKTTITAPRTPIEVELARIWAQILGLEGVGIYDDFFELGGHSLQAVSLFTTIEHVTGKKLPLATLLQAPTVAQLANLLCQDGGATSRSSLVPIQPVGSKPPLFCIPAHTDNILIFRGLARYLGREQPVYALQAQSLDRERALCTPVEEIAAHYIREILTVQPQGPFFLAGFCFGGFVAFEMAQQLQSQGHEGVLPILFETYRRYPSSSSITSSLRFRVESLRLFMFTLGNIAQLRPKDMIVYLGEAVKRRIKKRMLRLENRLYSLFGRVLPQALQKVENNRFLAVRAYIPQVYPGRMIFFLDSETPVKGPHNPVLTWGQLAAGGLEVHRVPGQWSTIFQEPHVQVLAEQLRACLEQAQAQALCQRI